MFRTLSHPPSSPFAFAFYIHGLVEACLANVMIVDERLAADLLFDSGDARKANDHFSSHLAEHQKAGVFPVFRFRKNAGNGNVSGHYTEDHRKMFAKIVTSGRCGQEGVQFSENKDETQLLILRTERFNTGKKHADGMTVFEDRFATQEVKGPDEDGSLVCDVLVIHEGALDLLANSTGGEWARELSHLLWKISPAVVRTSGRGRHTKHLYDKIPFVEFNEISSAVLTARNKVSLVRGLLGTTGVEIKNP